MLIVDSEYARYILSLHMAGLCYKQPLNNCILLRRTLSVTPLQNLPVNKRLRQFGWISKDANLVFYLSVYPLLNTLQTSVYDVLFLFLCRFSVISDVIQKVQRHHDLIKVTCREIGNVY